VDRATATSVLHGLLNNTHQNYSVEGCSPQALKAVQLCLAAGVDFTVPMVPATADEPAVSLLAGSVHRPQAALLLIAAGAPIEQDILMALCETKGPPSNQEELYEAYQEMATQIATAAPHLAWHTKVKNSPGAFNDFIPACMRIEDYAPGFNATLEKEQARRGLPVGCLPHIITRQDREFALADLVSGYPDMYFLGDRARVDVLRELMQDDISADMLAEGPTPNNPNIQPVTLLESFLSNTPDEEVVVELLNRGATVSVQALRAISYPSPGTHEWVENRRQKIFMMLLNRGDVDLDGPLSPDSSISLREYLNDEDPATMALFEGQGIDHQTQGVSRKTRGPRL
jgi:hypothetical protein